MQKGTIREAYQRPLSHRINHKYKKVKTNEAMFHAIGDLWRIFNDQEITNEIAELVSTIVEMPNSSMPTGIAHAAVNDLLAANLMNQFITPATARKIRKVIFNRNDLHGVSRADLFNPKDGTISNPVFDMVGLGGVYPGIFRYLQVQSEAAKDNTEHYNWDSECFIPLSIVRSVLLETFNCFSEALQIDYAVAIRNNDIEGFTNLSLRHTTQLAQFAAWQTCPVLLKFDGLLIKLLNNSASSQKIPRDIIRKFPYWSAAIETPEFEIDGETIHYLMLSFDSKSGKPGTGLPEFFPCLTITAYSDTQRAWGEIPCSYSLLKESVKDDVQEAAERVLKSGKSPLGKEAAKSLSLNRESLLKIGVQIALYLASDKPDYSSVIPDESYERKSPSTNLISPKVPHEFNVGETLASSLTSMTNQYGDIFTQSGGTRGSVKPHWRRAHWHLYWTGKGRTKKLVRWIPPTPINVTPGDKLPVISRTVDLELCDEAVLDKFDPGIDESFFVESSDKLH